MKGQAFANKIGAMELVTYAEAVERSFPGGRAVDYALGGLRLRVETASGFPPEIFGDALAHLECAEPALEPDLTISVWHSSGGHKPPPALRWNDPRFAATRSEFLRDGRTFVLCELFPHKAQVLDIPRRRAFFWISDPDAIEDNARAAPFRLILHWWLKTRGIVLGHGAAVGRNGRGVLLAGAGGAGKSTTALTCLRAGMDFAGDDYCGLSGDGAPKAFGLYSSAKLWEPDRFSWLPPASSAGPGRKAIFHLHPHFAPRLVSTMELSAILLPRVCDLRDTSVTELHDRQAAVQALVGSTMRQLWDPGQEEFFALYRIAKSLPCYRLDLGSEPEGVVRAIEPFVGEGR